MPILRVEPPDAAAFDVELRPGVFTIGRALQNDLQLQSLSLSRQHARLIGEGDTWRIEDCGSRNGTFVNKRAVAAPEPLSDGDLLRIGDVQMRFTVRRTPSVTLTPDALPRADQTFVLRRDDLDFKRFAAESRSGSRSTVEEATMWPILNDAAATLITHYSLDKLLEVIIDIVFRAVPAQRGALLLVDGDGKLETRIVRTSGAGTAGAAADQDLKISKTIVQQVLSAKEALLTLDAQTDARLDQAQSIRIQGIRSVLCVPLWASEEVRGLIYLDSLVGQKTFSQSDLRLVGLIANMAAVKIENLRLVEAEIEKERLDEQLEVAARIQRRLLPQGNPDIPGYRVCGLSQPCYEIGGDYFDFLRRADGKWGFVVADVSGKGVGAALLMSAFQAIIRTLAREPVSPAALISRIHEVLIENSAPGKFVTAFYGELDLASGALEYVNAGHNPALVVTDGAIHTLKSTGPVLGLVPGARYRSEKMELPPGGMLTIYSDGFTEAENEAGEEFGLERLQERISALRSQPPAALSQALFQGLREFEGKAPRKDDCTLLLVQRPTVAE